MVWVIITILAALVGGGGLLTGFFGSGDARDIGVLVFALSTFVWLLISVGMMVHTVGQRQVGIVYNFSGTITGKVDPGVAWTAPWQHIKKENVGLQREDFDLGAANSAVSQDQQPIFARLTVNFQVEPAKVVELFKTVGPAWKQTLLDSRVLQDFKEVTSGFTAQQVTTSRPALREQTKERLANEMRRYDITIVDVFVSNLDYSQAYSKSIEAKNTQVQKALQAQAKIAQSEAEAKQKIAKAKGESEANRLISNSCTDRCIQLRAIEKLNPLVQVVYAPAGSSFLIPQIGVAKGGGK